MSIAAMVFAYTNRHDKLPRLWIMQDIYTILVNGNDCYAETLDYVVHTLHQLDRLRENEYFLAASQIKQEVKMFDHMVRLELRDVLYSYVLKGDRRYGGLDEALDTFFNVRQHHYGIIIADKRARCLFFQDNKYYIFDPHAVSPNKTACLIEFETLEDMYQELKELIRAERPESVLTDERYDLIPLVVVGFEPVSGVCHFCVCVCINDS